MLIRVRVNGVLRELEAEQATPEFWSDQERAQASVQELKAGAAFVTPAGTPHYQWARTEVVLQIVGAGAIEEHERPAGRLVEEGAGLGLFAQLAA